MIGQSQGKFGKVVGSPEPMVYSREKRVSLKPLSWVELLHKKTLWQGVEDKAFIREVIPGSTGRGWGQGEGSEKKPIQGMLASG